MTTFVTRSHDEPDDNMPPLPDKTLRLILLVPAILIALASLAAFALFIFGVPLPALDLHLSEARRLGFDLLPSLSFFLQHSIMIRRGFHQWLETFIPRHYHRILYTFCSGTVLLVCMLLWQRSDIMLMELQGLPRLGMRGLFFLAIAGMCWGMWSLRSIDLFGIGPAVADAGTAGHLPEAPLVIRGAYAWVRHPLYLLTILLIWSAPSLTADRLLFNCLWTLWIVGGTMLEERDLVHRFGDAYRQYQRKVPMLVPRGWRRPESSTRRT